MVRRLLVPVLIAAFVAVVSPFAGTSASADPSDPTGTYYRVTSQRALDTRSAGAKQPLGAGGTARVQITGKYGVPSAGVSAVVVNLTAVGAQGSSYFSVYPTGGDRPNVSTMAFAKGFTGANMATVPVGEDGSITVYNNAGKTHALVDVLGFYAAGGQEFLPGTKLLELSPGRVYDSREDGPHYNGEWIGMGFTFDSTGPDPDAIDSSQVQGMLLNVTAVNPTANGYLTAQGGEPNRSFEHLDGDLHQGRDCGEPGDRLDHDG